MKAFLKWLGYAAALSVLFNWLAFIVGVVIYGITAFIIWGEPGDVDPVFMRLICVILTTFACFVAIPISADD